MNSKLIYKISLVIILFVILFTACENLNDPGEAKYKHSIFFKLNSGMNKQRFYIYNVVPLTEYSFGYLKQYDKYFDPSGIITIESNDVIYSEFHIESDSENIRYYTSDSLIVLPGIEYKLTIKIGEEVISGTTTIPGDFQFINPIENQIIPYTNTGFMVNYKWTSSVNSFGYLIQITYPFIVNGVQHEEVLSHNDESSDTLYNFSNYIEPIDTVYSIISAYDKNYFEHIFKGKESAGIFGAYGYFGSSVNKKVRYIVR